MLQIVKGECKTKGNLPRIVNTKGKEWTCQKIYEPYFGKSVHKVNANFDENVKYVFCWR